MGMSLGRKIVHLRKQKNWNQRELAEQLGVSQRQLVKWELNQVDPRPSSIALLAEVLDTTPEELVGAPSTTATTKLEDEELRELLDYIPKLDPQRLEALKLMLKDMIACDQFTRFRGRQDRLQTVG
jgi:transcriptional regulator with XRE-family HTH domain